ncbi:MAG: M20 metallopeptidase family protein [Acidimicrobiales bacterium]
MSNSIAENLRSMMPDLVELRHALHQEPEIGLDLPKTQAKVVSALGGTKLEISTGERLSSVMGLLRGARPGPTVLLRGDMDALPVQELVDVDFRSRHDGVMHACGHDLHTAMLVGAAHALSAQQQDLAGNVVFMFQPGEEGFDGAGHMIEEGIMNLSGETPAAAFALHVMSAKWPQGVFTSRSGPMMAASDELAVTVKGAGGHGSAPHLAKDPVLAACEMAIALQTYLTRSIDAFETVVITIGSFHAGTRRNIIPEYARFEATVRTFNPDVRAKVASEAVRVCEGIARAHGLEVDARFNGEYPVTVNTEAEVSFASEVVSGIFGHDRFALMDNPVTGAEDFSRVLNLVPGAMLFLGATSAGEGYETSPNNHSPYASFDDAVIYDGATLYSELARTRLLATSTTGVGGAQ